MKMRVAATAIDLAVAQTVNTVVSGYRTDARKMKSKSQVRLWLLNQRQNFNIFMGVKVHEVGGYSVFCLFACCLCFV